MKYTAIIVAAGSGSRFGSQLNKVWHLLNGKPVLFHSIDKFLSDLSCEKVIVVYSRVDQSRIHSAINTYPSLMITEGGSCRQESVNNGLQFVSTDYVLIHDGARPFFSETLLRTLTKEVVDYPSIIPALASNNQEHPDREVMIEGIKVRVQTPQAFLTNPLKQSFKMCANDHLLESFRDDASILEHYHHISPRWIPGESSNLKITFPSDLPSSSCD